MKVYIVTAGEYSDYRIEGVFLDQEKARIYSITHQFEYPGVEEYEVIDDVPMKDQDYIRVTYNFTTGAILSLCLSETYDPETVVDFLNGTLTFCVNKSNKRLYDSIVESGEESKLLLKIAYDKKAQWQYEHGLSNDGMRHAHEAAWKAHFNALYNHDQGHEMNTLLFASTSSDTPSEPPADPVGAKLKVALDKSIINGDALPTTEELQKMADEIRTAGCDEQ